MVQKYEYLNHQGRRIFNAIYDKDFEAEKDQMEELIKELLRIFGDGIVSTIRENGEIPNITALVARVRAPLLQGIFSEATLLGQEQKHINPTTDSDFPLRNAVNRTREKIETLLSNLSAKGSDAALAYIERLLKESSNEASAFRKQAEEALQKYRGSEEIRRKLNARLSSAIVKFNEHKNMIEARQSILEGEKEILLEEQTRLLQDVERLSGAISNISRENQEFKQALDERTYELLVLNNELENVRKKSKRGESALNALKKLDKKLKSIARDGRNGPGYLQSILDELKDFREKQERYESQNRSYSNMIRKNEELKAINEAIIEELERQKKLVAKIRLDSILDHGAAMNERIIESYYQTLDIYFILSLRECSAKATNDTELLEATEHLSGVFSVAHMQGLNPLELGKARLKEKKQQIKEHTDLEKYNLERLQIEQVYIETILFLESLIKKRGGGISAYLKIAGMYSEEEIIM